MNRLVLIGNGFDLALGLKTGYVDFLIWLIKKHYKLARQSGHIVIGEIWYQGHTENTLFTISYRTSYVFPRGEIFEMDSLEQINSYFKTYGINLKYKQPGLFNSIYSNAQTLGWVDIEERYYNLLKETLARKNYLINTLNNELEELSKELEQYLIEITQDHQFSSEQWDQMASHFISQIEKDKISHTNEGYIGEPQKLCFLNFNYTNSVYEFVRYFKNRYSSDTDIINIHGELDNSINPMIFGFGDEIDEHYKTIENKNDNKYFQHIKSFGYFTTSNYHDMLRFLEEDNYQVFIYGHSCGLSDRTLLKEVFEHENCRSIKIFYYQGENGDDDFKDKTMEISRHFDNKGEMRKKIMSKQYSGAIPQLSTVQIPVEG